MNLTNDALANWFSALLDFWLTEAGPWRGNPKELYFLLLAVAVKHDAAPQLVPQGAMLSRAVRVADAALAESGWLVTFKRCQGRRVIAFSAIVAPQ